MSSDNQATKGCDLTNLGPTLIETKETEKLFNMPPRNLGMRVLDKTKFVNVIKVLGVKTLVKDINQFVSNCKPDLLNRPKLRNIVNFEKDEKLKVILFDTKVDESLNDLTENSKEVVKEFGKGFIYKDIELGYDFWNTDQILNSILPKELPAITAFTTVGHIAHLNLKEEYLPFKSVIGQVILDKNKNIRTVVNKLDAIDTTFRFFKMEVLAGEDNMITVAKENGCNFHLDFSKVYWNSRLHTEHTRLIDSFQPDDIICDAFAGIGPFAIPTAKKKILVYANDLNPVSFEYLNQNLIANKIDNANLKTFNLDARDFIKKSYRLLFEQNSSVGVRVFDHAIMNLPATALEFLDAFRNIFSLQEVQFLVGKLGVRIIDSGLKTKVTKIHCHCFSRDLVHPKQDIIQRASQSLGRTIDEVQDQVEVHLVRSVAPNKNMYCFTFYITLEDLCLSKEIVDGDVDDSIAKRNVDSDKTIGDANEEETSLSKKRKMS